jgi:hypothetical protein
MDNVGYVEGFCEEKQDIQGFQDANWYTQAMRPTMW